jgi:hypothetical protein
VLSRPFKSLVDGDPLRPRSESNTCSASAFPDC